MTEDLFNRKIKTLNVYKSTLTLQGSRGLKLTSYKIKVEASTHCVNIAAPGTFLHDKFLQDHPKCNPEDLIFLQLLEFAEDPRIIKSHLPFSLLSPSLLETCKVIYMARDPRDVVVSLCLFSTLINAIGFVGSTSDFVEHFVNDTCKFLKYKRSSD
ncbi:Sulfotransferase 1C4 [Armadillidium vulgare]|nr:Sulfotransferase 1C4 [Armadillidium vulgare]